MHLGALLTKMDFLPSALRPNGRDRARNVEDGLSGDTLQFPGPPQLSSRRATVNSYFKTSFQ